MSYTDAYNYILLNGVNSKEDVELYKAIKKIEEFRKSIAVNNNSHSSP